MMRSLSFKLPTDRFLGKTKAQCAPLLITLAPPLCGVEEAINKLQEPFVTVSGWSDCMTVTADDLLAQPDDNELKLLVMLFLCRISVGEFFARMTAIQLDAPSVLDAVCDAAADLLALGCSLDASRGFQLMDADRSPAILHAAQTALKKDHRLICWNSTEGIADVLQIACAQHRRVRFLRWGEEIPSVPLQELIARNLRELVLHNKYIPSNKLVEVHGMMQAMLADHPTHSDLAKMFGFDMDEQGRVHQTVAAGTNAPSSASSGDLEASYPWEAWTNTSRVQALHANDTNEIEPSSLSVTTAATDMTNEAVPAAAMPAQQLHQLSPASALDEDAWEMVCDGSEEKWAYSPPSRVRMMPSSPLAEAAPDAMVTPPQEINAVDTATQTATTSSASADTASVSVGCLTDEDVIVVSTMHCGGEGGSAHSSPQEMVTVPFEMDIDLAPDCKPRPSTFMKMRRYLCCCAKK